MKKLVYGVGINDANYVVKPTINGKQQWCSFYQAWTGMLERCYSAKWQAKSPTYIGCMVCEEWHSFMSFRAWMITRKKEKVNPNVTSHCISNSVVYIETPRHAPTVPKIDGMR